MGYDDLTPLERERVLFIKKKVALLFRPNKA